MTEKIAVHNAQQPKICETGPIYSDWSVTKLAYDSPTALSSFLGQSHTSMEID